MTRKNNRYLKNGTKLFYVKIGGNNDQLVIFANYFPIQLMSHDNIPLGTKTLILSKLYYGVLSKNLEKLDTERYFSVLHFIRNNNGCCCQQEVCDNLHIDKTAMVKILDALTKAGLIERKTNPEDRRQHFLVLSKKGEKQTKEITKTFESLDKDMFKGIPEKDCNTFKKVLDSLIVTLQEKPKNDLFFNYKKTRK